MYGHGIMTLMFAEMLGQGLDDDMDKKIRTRVQRAVELIIRSQDVIKSEANRGGWRYEPGSSDSDISVSVWQVMSLRAAKNAGLDVPKEAIDKAVAYIKRSYRSERNADGTPQRHGGRLQLRALRRPADLLHHRRGRPLAPGLRAVRRARGRRRRRTISSRARPRPASPGSSTATTTTPRACISAAATTPPSPAQKTEQTLHRPPAAQRLLAAPQRQRAQRRARSMPPRSPC